MAKTLVYQMWPLAWNGLKEMTDHLSHIKELDVDYVWLGPLYALPNYDRDDGLDGYKTIDKRFGTMQEFDDFVEIAHQLNLRVIMELSLDPVYPHCTYDSNVSWFNDGKLNRRLVRIFKRIIKFWLREHGVDGFCLSLSRSTDKKSDDGSAIYRSLSTDKAIEVINAIFGNFPTKTTKGKLPFLIVECFDPTFGDMADYYYCYTTVNFVINSALKDAVEEGLDNFYAKLDSCLGNEGLMLSLESPGSPRFTTRSGLSATEVAEVMFESSAKAICLYQGQETGEANPTRSHISLDRYGIQGPYRLYCVAAESWKYRRW